MIINFTLSICAHRFGSTAVRRVNLKVHNKHDILFRALPLWKITNCALRLYLDPTAANDLLISIPTFVVAVMRANEPRRRSAEMYKQNARRKRARPTHPYIQMSARARARAERERDTSIRTWTIASPVRIIPKCKERIKFVEPSKSHYICAVLRIAMQSRAFVRG